MKNIIDINTSNKEIMNTYIIDLGIDKFKALGKSPEEALKYIVQLYWDKLGYVSFKQIGDAMYVGACDVIKNCKRNKNNLYPCGNQVKCLKKYICKYKIEYRSGTIEEKDITIIKM